MVVKTGDQAPSFGLFNTEKQKINLADQKGRNVLLLFFPLAFTSTCTAELCGVRDNIAVYNSANAVVFGISVDSPHSLRKFKEEQHFNFELLSDFNKEVSESYGAIYPVFGMEMRGVSKRAAFIIDKEGIVRYAEVLENASEVPDFGKINGILQTLN